MFILYFFACVFLSLFFACVCVDFGPGGLPAAGGVPGPGAGISPTALQPRRRPDAGAMLAQPAVSGFQRGPLLHGHPLHPFQLL